VTVEVKSDVGGASGEEEKEESGMGAYMGGLEMRSRGKGENWAGLSLSLSLVIINFWRFFCDSSDWGTRLFREWSWLVDKAVCATDGNEGLLGTRKGRIALIIYVYLSLYIYTCTYVSTVHTGDDATLHSTASFIYLSDHSHGLSSRLTKSTSAHPKGFGTFWPGCVFHRPTLPA
jgi:hypothetical protein